MATAAFSSQSLLYLETQGVVGSSGSKLVYYSQNTQDAMQQNSLGFDYLQKLSGSGSDFGTLALQGRVSYLPEKLSTQLYNAYLKLKSTYGDIWIGHDKPAMGLSSWVDNHAWLLPVLAMKGFGYDRDWGVGLSQQREDGEDRYALTTGSGMSLVANGNYLLSAHKSWGVLSKDNASLGISAAYGKVYEAMGYEFMMDKPVEQYLLGIDHSYNWDNNEWLGEVYWGQKDAQLAYALFGRLSTNLWEENRLKVELQGILGESFGQQLHETSVGLTYLLTPEWTTRALYQIDSTEPKFVLQCYYYTRL